MSNVSFLKDAYLYLNVNNPFTYSLVFMRTRSRAEQKAMFSRLSSFSDFNRSMNREFVKGIPSPSESVFTNKTMELDIPMLGNVAPYNRDVFGIDISDAAVDGNNSFSVDPDKFAKIVNIEESIRHYRVNEPIYRKGGISLDDFLTVSEAKRKMGE